LGDTFVSVGIAASTFADKMYLQVEALFTLTAVFQETLSFLLCMLKLRFQNIPQGK
jgi:hypothetical protein